MWETCYLLDVSELTGKPDEQAIKSEDMLERMADSRQVTMQEMEALLDKERLLKYQALQSGRPKSLSLGAGTLLRLAWTEARLGRAQRRKQAFTGGEGSSPEGGQEGDLALEVLTPEQVLRTLRDLPCVPEPSYCHGEHGKPYFKGSHLSFSLSHSGDLVLCAISDVEVGADVQRVTDVRWEKLASRYFASGEQMYLSKLKEDGEEKARDEFFRLWCRKEAFGKMTGEGAVPYLGVELLKTPQGFQMRDGVTILCGVKYYHCICRSCFSELQ